MSTELIVAAAPSKLDLLALHAADPKFFPVLLQSTSPGPQGAYDLLLASSGEYLLWHANGQVERDGKPIGLSWWEAMVSWCAELSVPHRDDDLPFHGGWALFLSYELAGDIEPSAQLPPPPYPAPRALALRCPAAIVHQHRAGRTLLLAEAEYAELLGCLQQALARGGRAPLSAGGWLVEEEDPQRFLSGVERVLDYLRAGDVFQVNLSRRWTAHGAGDPYGLYAALCASNPAPFAASLRWRGLSVLSSSPERLLRIQGDRIETRPIAGTRPRVTGHEAARIAELLGDPKERAEHIMLIDLERNDLGRVAVPGSVEVNELGVVESYAHVHHIVSNVRARRRTGVSALEVIRAVFPGGTITGCPKVRAMQIIAELEGEGRGAYTGSLGILGRDGDLDLNILIRTMVHLGDRVILRAGSGIVADSNPQRELEETRAKARGLLRALGHHGPAGVV